MERSPRVSSSLKPTRRYVQFHCPAFYISFPQKTLPAEFVAEQKAVDAAIMGKMKKDGILVRYLRARFTLSNGVHPHELKF